MGKGYKRKTRWRTLNIGAPPGEEDEEDGIRNGYAKGQENGTSSKNVPGGHKAVRTDSAGSATSDYASDYASAVSKSKRGDTGGPTTQPKIIFDETEYTRITTPRQDVLFKKGYLSRKKTWPSTASMSATPSTTESQSASHSTADGSETTEDQRLLDCKENGAEEYPAMMEPGMQVAYGTFYDHTSGYYYEYPVMVVGPGPGIPSGPPINNVLTAVPCGPVPLRPIEWVNPAFVPKLGNEQYCVADYQTAQLGQYPTLVDENGVPLTAQMDNTNGGEETYYENGNGSASWAGSVADDEQTGNNTETLNGTTETSSSNEVEEVAQASVNSEVYLETALAQQLHVTHVPIPPTPELYVYPGHYMFGPSLINVNGVTIQSGPMVRNTGINEGPTNSGACAKRRKKKRFSRRKARLPLAPGNAEDEEQEEEEEYSSEVCRADENGQSSVAKESTGSTDSSSGEMPVTASLGRPLNPDCQEFRPVLETRIAVASSEARADREAEAASDHRVSTEASPSGESAYEEQRIEEGESKISLDKPAASSPTSHDDDDDEDRREPKNPRASIETSTPSEKTPATTKKLAARQSEEISEAKPVDFAAEVIANVTIIAERAALASRSVVEGTPMETEIGLDATALDFQEIVEKLEPRSNEAGSHEDGGSARRGKLEGSNEREAKNDSEERRESCERTSVRDGSSGRPVILAEKGQRDPGVGDKRGSRSVSPGVINRTTTPINANSHRLPESYESLVIRGATCGQPQQPTRSRKYSSKAPKFVREATPGPDLDGTAEPRRRNDAGEALGESADATRSSRASIVGQDENERGAIATGVDALENESRSLSTTGGSGSYAWWNAGENTDLSNDDSGIDTRTRLSSEHPITDAVTEWLQRANSPELFVTRAILSDDGEPEDDELENEEPPKNLQGNPMPALSANSGDANNAQLSRSARFGRFAIIDEAVVARLDNSHDIGFTRRIDEETRSSVARRRRRGDDLDKGKTTEEKAVVDLGVGAARRRSSENASASGVEKIATAEEVCEFTEDDSVAGMRVAKSSRTKRRSKNKASSMASEKNGASSEDRQLAEKAKRSRRKGRTNENSATSGRGAAIENVEIKVRRVAAPGEDNDEGIVEDDEIGVKTFEKGRIVVSNEGKVLPVDNYRPILLKDADVAREDRREVAPKFSKITCERSARRESSVDETSDSETGSKRNSLGSIEEPDVLECWEIETVEPLTTPKRIQARGRSLEGEDNEEESAERRRAEPSIDPVGVEIVRKYYRLEAMGESATSLEDDPDTENNNELASTTTTRLERPENTTGSERTSKIVRSMLEKSNLPIDEAVEVYESFYAVKEPPAYLIGSNAKYRNSIFHGRDAGREGAAACKAACCVLQ